MKKFLYVVFGLLCLVLLVGPRAFASRARLLVYGSGDPTNTLLDGAGNGGSYYYESPYSIVYNPALLSQVADQLIIEKSNEPGTAAQGAIFKDFDFVKTAFLLGRKGEATYYGATTQIRPVEAYVSMGREKFSGGLGISFFERLQNKTPDRDLKVKLGTTFKVNPDISVEPFGHYKIFGREKTQPGPPKHTDFGLGTRVVYKNVKAFGGYRRYKIKNDTNGRSRDAFGFGAGHSVTVNKSTSLIYALGFWRLTNNDQNIIPLNMAAETQVLSWLTLRGGLEYHFHNEANETTVPDNTTGRIGFTAGHENLNFDFVVGSNLQGSGTAAAHQESADQADSQSFGFDSGFFSAAALRYLW